MDRKVVIDVELGTKSFEAQIKSAENKLDTLVQEYKALEKAKPYKGQKEDLIEMQKEIEKTENSIISLRQKQQELNDKHVFEGIGDSITGVIKKVGKWALAVFGIRSAYSFVRSAISTISQYNDQVATDVEYIRYALATSLQPLIEGIIKLAYQLLGILNSITKSLFGWDMFKNAGANAFKKANKGAKELQKTLAGFDKLNILNDNGTTGAVGGVAPSMDLSKMGDVDLTGVTTLLDRIKDLFNKAFDGIVENMKKVLRDFGFSEEFLAIFEGAFNGLKTMINGLFDFIIGIVKVIVGFLTGNTDLVKQGVDQAIKGMYTTILGFFQFIINSLRMLPQLILEILGMIGRFIYDKLIKPIGDWFSKLPDNMETSISNGVKSVNEWFNKIPEKLHEVRNRAVELFKNMGTSVGTVISSAFKSIINAVLARAEFILNKPISTINSLIDKINGIPGISLGRLSTIRLPRMAKGGILNMPGRGVDYYGANIAERGAEAVIPMTNQQSLETIGRTIAKYTKFDANVTLELEGRILARVMQEINSDRNFARNGG